MEPKLVALQPTSVTPSATLLVSLELGSKKWHVAATDGGTRVCEYTVQAGDGAALVAVLERARARLGLAKDAAIVSCYEAGRDGFWLHRFLQANGIRNHVIDAGSIEVNRRQRRAKTDRLDVRKLLSNLARFLSGEKKVWAVLRIPTEAEEDVRRPHRERARLVEERSQHIARMKSLLVMQNVRLKRISGRGLDGAAESARVARPTARGARARNRTPGAGGSANCPAPGRAGRTASAAGGNREPGQRAQ